ncbi:MAG: ATP-binding protein, partial [Fusobacteriaceae bacterium]|nr:ATP-binding protein [Fusobacteriaceae bacterium]MBU9919236.1 ATP-binding protein [Fusobacteriaceae bacterium]
VKILNEYNNQEKLKKHGLKHRRKILLSGHPGTGKTMSASIIASELHLPLYVIQIDKIITKFMGETGAKLRQIFKMIEIQKGVYFFDEFDSIGTDRSKDNEVGEMRRVLNSFLQFLENDNSDSLIITATNNIALLDRALFRRFDDILYYDIPTKDEILKLLTLRLQAFTVNFDLDGVLSKASGLSHADIVKSCNDAIKEAIINDKKYISKTSLIHNFEIIKESYKKISES